MTETIGVTRDRRGVATLRLARGATHNALSAEMIAQITMAASALGADPGVRVVVLAAEGPSFCAGADLGWMRTQMAADAETRGREARRLALMLRALNELPKPLVARVQGNAFGGGVGLLAVCDVAVGVESLRMGLTETRLGLIPATIGPYVVARIGEAAARRVFFSGRVFGAGDAVRMGLLATAVPEADLDAAVEAEVAPCLSCAPGAVAEAKRLVRDLGPRIDDAVIDRTIAALVRAWDGEEADEGIAAFFAKRKPGWAEE